MGFVARWFTPSKSDSQSGAQYNEAYNIAQRASAPPPTPAAPTDADAKARAAEEVKRMKRMRAMAGGQTILTSEAPSLGGGGKTLLGS